MSRFLSVVVIVLAILFFFQVVLFVLLIPLAIAGFVFLGLVDSKDRAAAFRWLYFGYLVPALVTLAAFIAFSASAGSFQRFRLDHALMLIPGLNWLILAMLLFLSGAERPTIWCCFAAVMILGVFIWARFAPTPSGPSA